MEFRSKQPVVMPVKCQFQMYHLCMSAVGSCRRSHKSNGTQSGMRMQLVTIWHLFLISLLLISFCICRSESCSICVLFNSSLFSLLFFYWTLTLSFSFSLSLLLSVSPSLCLSLSSCMISLVVSSPLLLFYSLFCVHEFFVLFIPYSLSWFITITLLHLYLFIHQHAHVAAVLLVN